MGGTLCLNPLFLCPLLASRKFASPASGAPAMLVVHSAAGESLSEQLGALRSAVCIARALGAELVLPRWKCGPFWLSSKHVIDLAPVAALVPLVSESDAQARCTSRTASHSIAPAPPLMSHPHRQVPHRCGRHCPLRALGRSSNLGGRSEPRGLSGGPRAGHAGAARLEPDCGCHRRAAPVRDPRTRAVPARACA